MDLALNNLQRLICISLVMWYMCNKQEYIKRFQHFLTHLSVTYWPSTEPSIKRCTRVNKQENSENRCIRLKILEYHLDLWTWLNSVQMRAPTGSRWVSENYITRCHIRLELVSLSVSVADGDKMPAWESACRLRATSPQWTTVEQPNQNAKEVLLWSEELGVNMLQSVPISNSPLTHNQHRPFCNPFENKMWEVYFL